MKNGIFRIALVIFVIFCGISTYAAAPKIMIVPDKQWCNANGYVNKIEKQGKVRINENYDQAFLDETLVNVEKELKSIMVSYQYPVVSYLEQSEADDEEEMLEELFEGAESGSQLAENAFEAALNKAKPDILFKVGWTVNVVGFYYTASFRIDAIDSYSNKSVSTITAESERVSKSVALHALLKATLSNRMAQFLSDLRTHFDDVQTNGREMAINIRIIDNGSGTTFSSEFGDQELGTIIYNWMNDNTVNHQFSERTSSRNRLVYDQVRVPLKDASGRHMNAKTFVGNLQRYLKSNFGIVAENASSGLGLGRLYIGEK